MLETFNFPAQLVIRDSSFHPEQWFPSCSSRTPRKQAKCLVS